MTHVTSYERRRVLLEHAGWCPHEHVARLVDGTPAVLDVACGTGDFLGALRNVDVRVGVDVDERAVRVARTRHPSAEFHVTDVARLPLDERRFQAVTIQHALPHFGDEAEALKACARSLTPDGELWVSANGHSHLQEFWVAVATATAPHPLTRPVFRSQPSSVPPEVRLRRTLEREFTVLGVDEVTHQIALDASTCSALFDSYRDSFPCDDLTWSTASAALEEWLARQPDGTCRVTTSLVIAHANRSGS